MLKLEKYIYLVDKLYRLGLSVSYDRVMQISADLGNSVCDQFEKEGVVCPSMLKKSLFTTGSVDNIDHNPSSHTAKDSFTGQQFLSLNILLSSSVVLTAIEF